MAFEPKEWKDGEAGGTPITAAELNRLEGGVSEGSMTAAERAKLNGIAEGANNYTLPDAGSQIGGVKKGVAVELAEEGTEVETINALIASLKAAGTIA